MADQQSSDIDWQPRLSERAILGGTVYDIAKAKELIKATPRPVERKPLSSFKPMYYLLDIKIDWEKARQSDENIPIIAGTREGQPLIIDGWHRYAKLLRANQPDIAVVALTDDELKQVAR